MNDDRNGERILFNSIVEIPQGSGGRLEKRSEKSTNMTEKNTEAVLETVT